MPGHIIQRTCDVVSFTDTSGKKVTHILGEAVSLWYEDPTEIRKRALSKLTKAEREALGFTE